MQFFLATFVFLLMAVPALAQETAVSAPVPAPGNLAKDVDPSAVIAEAAPPVAPAYTSLLFTPPEMVSIRNAEEERQQWLSGQALREDLVGTLQETANMPAVRMVTHPQLYLAAIAFRNKDDWGVWINRVKYGPAERNGPSFTIAEVTPRQVTIEWKPVDMQLYQSRLSVDNPDLMFDAHAGAFRFTLSPNQTFSAFSMKVEEGWLPPSRQEEVSAAAGAKSAPPPPPPASVHTQGPSAAEAAANAEGLPTATLPAVPTFTMQESPKTP